MIGINFFAIAVCAIWLVCHRENAPVKVAQPLFLGLVLLGCLVSTSTIFALAQEHSGASVDSTTHIGAHANHGAIDHGHGPSPCRNPTKGLGCRSEVRVYAKGNREGSRYAIEGC